jgi:transaldolase
VPSSRGSPGCSSFIAIRRRSIAAAIRNGRQIAEAAVAGSHCVTAGFEVYRESFRNPYTDMGNAPFGAAWDETRIS